MNRPKTLASLAIIAALLIASLPWSIAEWVAVGVAPEKTGIYNVIIQATYQGRMETFPLQLVVNETPYEIDGLTVEPVYPISRLPPIGLKFDIKLNGSYDFQIISNTLTLYYASGNSLLRSEEGALSLSDEGYWYANVTVPFKGDYRAVVSLVVEKGGQRYGGEFVSHFKSDEASPDLVLQHRLEKRVLTPSEEFEAFLTATFEGDPLPSLEIFKANLYGSLKDLRWDRQDQAYDATFTAPMNEGIYLMSIYAEDQDMLIQDRVYVADTGRGKSVRCPLAVDSPTGCDDMKDVRKCVYDYKSDLITVSESDLISCFEAVTGGIIYGSIICEEAFKGDLDGDLSMDESDLEIMQNMILPLPQSARRDYADCADYDLDDDVDEQDLECMSNVVGGKWFGDENGGICFDAEYDTVLSCDLDGDEFIDIPGGTLTTDNSDGARYYPETQATDSAILKRLIDAAENGIGIPPEILETCDFNQDGRLDIEDENCMKYFSGMDLDNPETLLSGQTIPDKCMKVYGLDNCQGIRGDINGDTVIDALDEALIMMIEAKQIGSYSMECADVNKDGRITTEDILCVKSYTSGDREGYFICIGCDENLPQEYQFRAEICGDGYDNDCDGLVDRTSTGSGDLCQCNENTPCWMVMDADGGSVPGINDANVKVCRKVSWSGGGSGARASAASESSGSAASGEAAGAAGSAGSAGFESYQWMSPDELTCDQSKECETMECAETEFVCAFDGVTYDWYDDPAKMPEETDDPEAEPKLCDDGHDNDCRCGDVKCAEFEEGSMFKDWKFWVGAVAGFGASMFLGPQVLLGLSLLSSFLGAFCRSPDVRAFMSGFAVGIAVGNLVGASSWLGGGGEAAETAYTAADYTKANSIYTEAATKAKEAGHAAKAAEYTRLADEAAKAAKTAKAAEAATSTAKNLAEADKIMGIKSAASTGVSSGLWGTLTKAYMSKVGKIVTAAVAGIAVMRAKDFYAEKKGEWEHFRQDC